MKFYQNNMFLEHSKMNYFFLLMLMFSTMITINSSSWIGAWMGMEISLLSFIPLMMMKYKMFESSNSMMIYFMIQASSSCFLLFFTLMNKMEFFFYKIDLMNYFIQFSLLMKIGAAPFHWWTPKISNLLNWKICFILLTWQESNPLIMISLAKFSNLIYYSIIISLMIGSIIGLNQASLKLIITYSSINHISWLLISMMLNFYIFMIYFIIYIITILLICLFLNNFNINYMNQMFENNYIKKYMWKFYLISLFFSLKEIPPMLGFFPKFKIGLLNSKLDDFRCISAFIIFSLITLLFYMYPMMSSLILYKMNSKWNLNKIKLLNYLFLILTTNMLLSMIMILPLTFSKN
uniref:NADH-ubiquinone oxidoreductase chain 2 n=1 Tax=Cimbex luteus TaxID=1384799 RepID=A0A7T1C599_9HYME|nr:NADH dehydrogenase subunit 2 [Cimbex luteus]QPM99412.2 NADH dehydrogenase subunit 2 [Cimbex luteus]UXW64277.1 NADH dehydrogenase subunit 2 [Cimbex luteus]